MKLSIAAMLAGITAGYCNATVRDQSARRPAALRAFLALLGAVLFVPLLAASSHAQVTMTVDSAQNVQPISPYIYGVNLPTVTSGVVPLLGDVDASWNVTVNRIGGTRWQTYNWGNNYSNSACCQNDQFLSASTTPGAAVSPAINEALAHSAGVVLTIPLVGNSGKTYVSADSIPGNDVRCATNDFTAYPGCTHNPSYLTQRYAESNTGYQQQFVDWVKTNWPANLQAGAQFPIWFSLDNEPELWIAGHPELRGDPTGANPARTTYAELVSLTTSYATAIKVVAPNTLIFGAVTGVWEGKTSLGSAPDGCDPGVNGIGTCYSSDVWFLDYYLSQMSQASASAGKRLLDVLDTHFYSNALGGPLWTYNGTSILGQDTSAAVVAARVQAPRSLWDPNYVENSYITDSNHLNDAIKLIPRLQTKIANGYPGTKIAFTEWAYGGGASISGGIAAADALGIFGSHGVYAAMNYPVFYWLPNNSPADIGNQFIIGAFKMFRNYDGSGATFGDTSVSAVASDNAQMSIYASLDSTNPRRMVLVLINKTGNSPQITINLPNTPLFARGDVYALTAAASGPAFAGTWDRTNVIAGNQINIPAGSFPPYSVVTVNLTGATTTAVTPSANPSVFGQSVTFSATVTTAPAAGTPTGTVTFKEGATTLGSGTLSAGSATFQTSALSVGSHTITAVYGGDVNFATSTSSSVTQTVNKGATTTSLGATSASVFGQSVTFTATISVTSPASGTRTGTVTFKDGATTLGTGALSAGHATLQTSALSLGLHTITAVYGGDTHFVTSTSSGVTQTVNVGATTTALAPSVNPSVFGQSVTFTATISATSPASGTPTGTVTFKDGATTLGPGTLSAGIATFQTAALSVGSHTITAVYGGDSNFATSTSSGVTQVVNKGATTMTASATPAKVAPGAPVTLKAQIKVTSPAAAAPSGQVTFKDSGVTIGVGTIASGTAQFTVNPISIGTHNVAASYPGDSHVTASSANSSLSVDASVGPESRVNTATAGSQQLPAVAALKSGYVVAWASNGQDGSGFGVYAQRYTAAGANAGVEFPVNTIKTGDQTLPTVAGLSDGSFVVIWQSNGQDTSGLGIYGQRFTAAGAKSGSEFKVNTTTAGDQSSPAVAGLSGGGFVVTWQSNGQDGSGLGVYAQRYTAAGVKAGSEFKVNTRTAGDQSSPAVAGLSGGGFVVTWQSNGQDGSGLGVYAQRYDATGKTQASEFRANTVTLNDQSLPSIAPLDNGGFVIAWQSALQDGSGLGVYSQRYTAAGAPAGGETRVNTMTANDQDTPRVAAFSNGGYVIVWASNNQDGSGKGIYAQGFNDAGAKVNVEFKVNATTALNQYQPAVAAFASGNFVAVWTSQSSDGSLENVFAQRFLLPGTN